MNLSVDVLNDLLVYDATSGMLYWRERSRKYFKRDGDQKRWNTRYAGRGAMTPNGITGYIDGFILRNMNRAHRVAWAMYYGVWPSGNIDHINGNRLDNRIANLRCVTKGENARNVKRSKLNTSGVTGVSPFKGRWRACIRLGGAQRHLGIFDTLEAAAQARKAAEDGVYHPNHGRAA